MRFISLFSVPFFITLFIVSGFVKKVDVYDTFTQGAKEGMYTVIGILPSLIGLMAAISMVRASGAPQILANILSPALTKLHMPQSVLPLALLRPISGSASLGIVSDIFKTLGPDSASGKVASVMMGSTETTFYTVAIYFGAAGIKNTRYTLAAALTADLTAIIMSPIIVRVFLS